MDVTTYVSKAATSDEEKLRLINLGYEYTGVSTQEGHPILRRG